MKAIEIYRSCRQKLGNCAAKVGSMTLKRRGSQHMGLSWAELPFANISFSQFGEDIFVDRWFRERGHTAGTYVDVGAHHPFWLSNTHLLSKRGWSGLNIDISEEKMAPFHVHRPLDVNVAAVVSSTEGELEVAYYRSGQTDRALPVGEDSRESVLGEKPLQVVRQKSGTLKGILLAHGFGEKPINFVNVDCEGHDLDVLKGMDWARWHPELIAVEAHSGEELAALTAFLEPNGYKQMTQMVLTHFFNRAGM